MLSILITGAKGFVGKNLRLGLHDEKEFHITSLSHEDLDLTDENQVRNYFQTHSFDYVIDTTVAGYVRPLGHETNDSILLDRNLRMFFNVVSNLHADTKLIYFGSGAEYDKRYPIQKVKENSSGKTIPADGYGLAKYIMSKYAENNPNITCLRIFGLYGPHEDYAYKFISNSIVKTLFKLPIIIHQNVIFDYLYIADLIVIIKQLIKHWPDHRVMNVTPTESIDLITVSKIIQQVTDSKSDIRILNDGLNKEYTGDNQKLLQEISPFSFTSYYDGIVSLTEFYQAKIHELDENLVRNDNYLKYTAIRNLRK